MLKGLGDIANIMKMQKDLKNAQKNITRARIEGENPEGSVKAVVSGTYSLEEIKIDPALLSSGDSKKIEKAVKDAVNTAVEKVREFSAAEMGKLTGGMSPDLMNMFK